MNEKYYLTPMEQEVLNTFEGRLLISMEEIQDLFNKKNSTTLRNLTSSLMKKGVLHQMKRGLYLSTPDGNIDGDDLIRVAPLIYTGYIAFSSALYLHSLLDYHPFTILVATVDRARKIEFETYEVRYISMGRRCTGQVLKDGIWVSGLEKTFFDCFRKPNLSGGYQNVTKALFQTKDLDWKRFGFFMERYGNDSLCQRVGYILDMMKRETGFDVDEELLLQMSSKVKYITRLKNDKQKGTFKNDWKVIDNIGTENILSWWY